MIWISFNVEEAVMSFVFLMPTLQSKFVFQWMSKLSKIYLDCQIWQLNLVPQVIMLNVTINIVFYKKKISAYATFLYYYTIFFFLVGGGFL